ncbi:MAG: hypothetical protein H7Y43_03475 [Akkermansiaceae bacterium]|nr:hypothetical protein [Verrucomicrobiales bacterium]
MAFLFLAVLAILGGVLYAPTNYDALAYRTPRVLNWLAENQWHWVHTDFPRLNTRSSGIEWITAPLFLFSHTDRLEFIINSISFLFLPGLTFSILTRLKVARRTAWFWMWLFPGGYCFLLQAGSIANDLFGAVCAMAAFHFALQAREDRKIRQVWFSILAAALMTAGKATNLLLLLPWGVALLPSLRVLLVRPLATAGVMIFAGSASLLPTAFLNLRYCGDWKGLAAEPVPFGAGGPVLHVLVNSILLPLHNIAPPIFPFSRAWDGLVQSTLPASFLLRLQQHFEPESARLAIGEMQMEESAGLGMGLALLVLAVGFLKIKRRAWPSGTNLIKSALRYETLISLGAWAALVVFMAQSSLTGPARYLAPFWILLIAPILKGPEAWQLTYSRRWRMAGMFTFLLAGILLALTPPRPLWPAAYALRLFDAEHSSNPLIKRAWSVYSVYGGRGDAFSAVRQVLPADANPLGLITWDDPEASLWFPFGSRRIVHICRTDGPVEVRQTGVKYVLIHEWALSSLQNKTLPGWLSENHAEVIHHFRLALRAKRGPTDWYLVKLPEDSPSRQP